MKHLLIILALSQSVFSFGQTTLSLDSPSKNLNAELSIDGKKLNITLSSSENNKIVEAQTLLFDLEKNIIQGDWMLNKQVKESVNSSWKPIYGEKNIIEDCYNSLDLQLVSSINNKEITVNVRLYNEGLAFRYQFNENDFWNQTVKEEHTKFLFTNDYKTWIVPHAQGLYSETSLSQIKGSNDRPQVVKLSDISFVAIGEAALVDYARMKLKKATDGYGIESDLTGDVKLDLANYKTPWRYVIVGKTVGELVENNDLVLNLNEPNQIKNTNWIKPGEVIREVTLTTKGGKACVDFAAENNISYVEYDAGWYGNEYDEKSDATTVTIDPKRSKGPLDLHEVIRYAESKGIGIILYVNGKALKNQLDEILPLYKKWGVKGLKYGFVDVGDQYSTSWLHHAVRKAAKYELMVDIHDEYRPTGYSRTYPNLLTQEGIRGDEAMPTLSQTIYTLYNRMICGAGDYTNCYFAERVTDKMGGLSAQLAKRVALYSPWQFIFWYDRPENSPCRIGGAGKAESIIHVDPITKFYCSIPTIWDESLYLNGEMGDYAVVARRSGKQWYVAILNAGNDKDINIPLYKIYKGNADIILYHQDGKKKDKVTVKSLKKVSSDSFSVQIPENSGSLLVITPNL